MGVGFAPVRLLIVFSLGGLLGVAVGLIGTGSILAVPLLIYGASLDIHSAVCVSMLTVTVLGVIGTIEKFGEIEFRATSMIAFVGVILAPLGAWLNQQLNHLSLVVLFTVVVLAMSIRILIGRDEGASPVGKRNRRGGLLGRPMLQQALAGSVIGLIGGLLGISGGFIAVPVLVSCRGLEIHRAVATSWLIVAIISASATTAHLLTGQRLMLRDTLVFLGAAIIGFEVALRIAHHVSSRGLKRLFAAAVVVMTIVMLANISRS